MSTVVDVEVRQGRGVTAAGVRNRLRTNYDELATKLNDVKMGGCDCFLTCSQKVNKTEIDAAIKEPIAVIIRILCHRTTTSRNKNNPRDHLATAVPRTVKV